MESKELGPHPTSIGSPPEEVGRTSDASRGTAPDSGSHVNGVTGIVAAVGAAALAATACCGPFLLTWLAQTVAMLGGVGALAVLNQFEAPMAVLVAGLAAISARRSRNAALRVAYFLLTGAALMVALLRVLWDLGFALPFRWEPVSLFFAYRQAVLALLAFVAVIVNVHYIVRAIIVQQFARTAKQGGRPSDAFCTTCRQPEVSLPRRYVDREEP